MTIESRCLTQEELSKPSDEGSSCVESPASLLTESMSGTTLESPTRTERTSGSSELAQAEVNDLLKKYGGPLANHRIKSEHSKKEDQRAVVLLTGANGTLGVHVLSTLLADESIERIICLVRGDAWERLSNAFRDAGYKSNDLQRAKDSGKLAVFETVNLGSDRLGCSQEDYAELIRSTNTVIHLAWKIDVNLPASLFETDIRASRNLAELGALAMKEVSYFFISSFGAYARYQESLIPETPLSPNVTYALDQVIRYSHDFRLNLT